MRFLCSVCQQEFSSPLRTLDWRRQRLAFQEVGDAIQSTLHIEDADALRNYCSAQCRDCNEPDFIDALKLKFLSPKVEPVMPCGHCGGPVDSSQPHTAFAQVTLQLNESGEVVQCTGDRQLAVLCASCDPHDDAEQAAEAREWGHVGWRGWSSW
ncbi:hypothetical protein ACFSL5_16325 [Ottowia pentelensis]